MHLPESQNGAGDLERRFVRFLERLLSWDCSYAFRSPELSALSQTQIPSPDLRSGRIGLLDVSGKQATQVRPVSFPQSTPSFHSVQIWKLWDAPRLLRIHTYTVVATTPRASDIHIARGGLNAHSSLYMKAVYSAPKRSLRLLFPSVRSDDSEYLQVVCAASAGPAYLTGLQDSKPGQLYRLHGDRSMSHSS